MRSCGMSFVIVMVGGSVVVGCSSDGDQSDGTPVVSTSAPSSVSTLSVASTAPVVDVTEVVTTTAPVSTTTAPLAVSREALSEMLSAWIATVGAPGAVVGVRVGAAAPVVVAAGVDASTGEPLTVDAGFSIASLTKLFVGALALDLVDEGVMALDDPLSRFVPDFPRADDITIEQLLRHTSGIAPQAGEGPPPYPYEPAFQELVLGNLERVFTPAEIVATVRDRPLLFEPGTGIRYSNVNTILLGEAIATATGQDIVTALRTRVIDPAGLVDTYFGGFETGAGAAPGLFRLQDDGPLLNTGDFPNTGFLTAVGAAGAMISTPADLLAWSDRFLRPGIGDGDDLSTSRFAVTPDGLGLGVIVWSAERHGCVFYGGCDPTTPQLAVMGDGSNPGTNSALAYFPEGDVTIVAIANSSEVDVSEGLLGATFDLVMSTGG